jgi:deoxyribodipyrimidine photo-lyase
MAFKNNFSQITSQDTVVWFRRDLRLSDNAALYRALTASTSVQPIFIFDTQILDKLDDKRDRRVAFIHETLTQLQRELEQLGSTLVTFYGNPIDIFQSISPRAVYTNHDYEPYARERDTQVEKLLDVKGIPFRTFKDQVIFEKDEVLKPDGTPYTVFTPYSKKWKERIRPFFLKAYPTEKYFDHLKKTSPATMPSLVDMGFENPHARFPDRKIRQGIIEKYDRLRNHPAIEGTTRLSVHLRFGTVSIRKLATLAQKKNEVWLNELIWREFYHMILWHFPQVEHAAFKPAYDRVQWNNDEREFALWCEGKTGYPMVDAGMRELNETGFMHNRTRMVTASFLTKHLLIDWRWGEAYFARKLLDFDLAANNGGWQWAAGSGCDAAPYFRVFNPDLQQKKFDPDMSYILRWIPEYGTDAYPSPIVDHATARERVLKAYKEALDLDNKIIH